MDNVFTAEPDTVFMGKLMKSLVKGRKCSNKGLSINK